MHKLLIIICLSAPVSLWGQDVYRIRADFSIKAKSPTEASLTVGTAFYDHTTKTLIYDITFPRKEQWIIADTVMTQITPDSVKRSKVDKATSSSTVFGMVISGDWAGYGMDSSLFTCTATAPQGDMLVSTWAPKSPKLAEIVGNIFIGRKDRLIQSVIATKTDQTPVSQQYFNKYDCASGLCFPCELVQIIHKDGQKTYIVTTYRNLIFNEENDALYRPALPAE